MSRTYIVRDLHHFSILNEVALVSPPSHKFTRPPYCYYWL